jgi:transcriptional regulator with XRE-family HTH domain
MPDDDTGTESLGEFVRRLRREAGLTQEALAERAGLSSRTVRNLEASQGRQPRPASVAAVVEHLAPDTQTARRLLRLAAGPPPGHAPAQLPAAHAGFAGRDAEQKRMLDLLGAARTGRSGPALILVHGQPGAGKTALALRVAHTAAAQFADGALYADLQGTRSPADPHDVLDGWCRALGASPELIPRGHHQRAAHFRSMLAGRRVMILCDDARDAAQVRPLLPGTAGCAAVITSRLAFSAAEIAGDIPLGLLDAASARELVRAAVAWRPAVQDSPADPGELISRIAAACDGLPLALRIAAGRLAQHPAWTPAAYAELLETSGDRLRHLQLGDASVRAAFDDSYQALGARPDGAAAQGLFDQLAVHDGPFLTLAALTVVTGEPAPDVETRLDLLCQVHLADSPAPQRYSVPGLLRLYGRAHLPPAARRQVIAELAGYFTSALREAAGDPAGLADQWANMAATVAAAAACQPRLTTPLTGLLAAAGQAMQHQRGPADIARVAGAWRR